MSDPDEPVDPLRLSGPTSPADPGDAASPGASPEARTRRTTPRRMLGAGVALLIPLVPIVVGLLLGHGSSSEAATAQTTRSTVAAAASGAGAAGGSHARAATRSAIPGGSGALVAAIPHATGLHRSPGGQQFAVLHPTTDFHSPTFVLVTRVEGPWLGVIATAAGNNRIGWIRTSAASLSRDTWSLHAILAHHELVVSHDGRTVRHITIATGSPAAPTPTGRYAVTDRLTTGDDSGPYGCCILALSAKAPHKISDWDGGNRIAIHSTPEAGSIGQSVSHGCMRLSLADGRWLLGHIPLGTPTTVSTA